MIIRKLFKRKPDDMKTRIIPPVLELRITGKVTRPSVLATDPAFDTKKYTHTDLAATFRKAREQLSQR